MTRPISNRSRAVTLAVTVAVAGGLAQGGPAAAQPDKTLYVACYVYRVPESAAAYLPVVRSTSWEMFNNFEGKAEQRVLPNRQPGQHLSCKTGDTPEAAEAERVKTGYLKVAELPWPQGPTSPSKVEPAAASNLPPPQVPTATPPSSTAALTVKADTGGQEAARAWDERVKETLAAEARKRVEAAVGTAQADTKTQAEIAEFFKARRQQGRAQ